MFRKKRFLHFNLLVRIMIVHDIKNKYPEKDGHYLVLAPKSFPKNSRWLVAEYYADNKTFYSEASDYPLPDVTHWCELPPEPKTV